MYNYDLALLVLEFTIHDSLSFNFVISLNSLQIKSRIFGVH